MESRIKGRVLSIIVAGAMIASTSTVLAATTKPAPKATVKTTVKATPKPSAKPSAKPTPKPTPRPTKKPVVKKPATKRPVVRKPSPKKVIYKRKVVKVSPSPSPIWPPKKPFVNPPGSEIYYKIPTSNELLGALSAAAALSAQLSPCTQLACGVVTLGSANGCTWWEIHSTVYGPLSSTDSSSVPYGDLVTTVKATDKRQIVTVLLVSTEPLKNYVKVGIHDVMCHHDPVSTSPQKVPSNIYTVNTPAPTPSDLATTNTN